MRATEAKALADKVNTKHGEMTQKIREEIKKQSSVGKYDVASPSGDRGCMLKREGYEVENKLVIKW
jgi:hypothetical protein